MSFQTSFKQILKEKMAQTTPSSSANEGPIHNSDPANLAYLMGQIGRFEFQSPRGQYPRPKARPQPARKAHAFSAGQKLSYEFFKTYIHDISEGFTAVELKKAFRKTALILHPDRGGRPEQFMELKEHYEILRGLVELNP